MRIAFSLYGIGLGNNGGSRTIVKSANALVDLGHEVFIFSHCRSGYTWGEIRAKHVENRSFYDFPNVDVIVATGCKTAFHVYELTQKKLGAGAYWIRGIETWSNPMSDLVNSYKLPLLKMTNSTWQQEFIMEHSDDPIYIQYPGLELDHFSPEGGHNLGPFRYRGMGREAPFAIGGLFHAAPHKGFGTFMEIVKHFPEDRVRLLSATPISIKKGWDLCVSPSEEDKRDFYRGCSVWLATTDLDGLHLPPMEAGLCGAALVCNAKPQSGMLDHAIHKETALCFITPGEAAGFIMALKEQPRLRKSLNHSHIRLLHQKMGSRAYQMEKMTKLFEENL